jgi:diguanylate cyclase (GGDEF)-like protein
VVAESAGSPSATVSTSVLTRRLLVGTLLGVAAFFAAFLATAALETSTLASVVAGAAMALLVAAISTARTVSPIVATQADLQVRYEAALADALADPLTGLGNHRAFHEELDRQVEAALRYEMPVALVLVDLDEFKTVNDVHGHAGGDRVLHGFGQLLTASLRRADRAFRIGGDEFALVLPHTDLEGARIVTRRLLAQSLQPALRVEDLEPISFSAGISAVPEHTTTRVTLFSQADAALYAAKRAGRTEIVGFDPGLESIDHDAAGTAAAAIGDVIARGLLRPVYQPIVAFDSGRIIGVEGLIRPVSPAPFADPGALFAAAEAGGRIVELDLACVDAIVAGAAGLPVTQFLSINLSPATLESAEFTTGAMLRIFGSHGMPAARIVVELTERQALGNAGRVRERVEALRRAGVRFAADDIGAGNAGLRLLTEIRFDIVKVDLGLVQRSAAGGLSGAVLESVVELAARTGALVVAEGIEQPSQLAQLSALGIGAGQGFHLGRPGPIVTEARPVAEVPAVGMAAWRQSIGLPSVS